ncbi:MAG: hypothetical protein JW904_10485 [Spirochaetales bacterium]|nr:hypothetical protein [Spirochaetales bacterium]
MTLFGPLDFIKLQQKKNIQKIGKLLFGRHEYCYWEKIRNPFFTISQRDRENFNKAGEALVYLGEIGNPKAMAVLEDAFQNGMKETAESLEKIKRETSEKEISE